MTVYLFYTLGSPHQGELEQFAAKLQRERLEPQLVEADSRDGIRLMELYDVLSRPSVVLANHDGSAVERWQGEPLPSVGDVTYRAHSI